MNAHDEGIDVANPVRYFDGMGGLEVGGFMRWSFPDGYPDCGGWESIETR